MCLLGVLALKSSSPAIGSCILHPYPKNSTLHKLRTKPKSTPYTQPSSLSYSTMVGTRTLYSALYSNPIWLIRIIIRWHCIRQPHYHYRHHYL